MHEHMDSHHTRRTMTPRHQNVRKVEDRAKRQCVSQSNPVKNPISIFDVRIEGGDRDSLKSLSDSPKAQIMPRHIRDLLSHKMRNRNEINSPSEPQEIKPSPDRALTEFLNLALLPPTRLQGWAKVCFPGFVNLR